MQCKLTYHATSEKCSPWHDARMSCSKLYNTRSARDTQRHFWPVISLLLGRRAEKQQLQAQVQILQARAERSERALEPLRARVRDLTAQVESHAEEVNSVRHAKPLRSNPCR